MMVDGSMDMSLGWVPERSSREIYVSQDEQTPRVAAFVPASSSANLDNKLVNAGAVMNPLAIFDVFFFPVRILFDVSLAVYAAFSEIAAASDLTQASGLSVGGVVNASNPAGSYFTPELFTRSMYRGH